MSNFLHADLMHYSLLSLGITLGVTSIWLIWTSGKQCLDVTQKIEDAPFGMLILGIFLLVAAVVVLGIFQDMRLDHLCAIHGTCR